MRLSRLLVITEPTEADWPMMDRIVNKAAVEPHPGLPRKMREGLVEAAGLFRLNRKPVDYWFVCLIAVQARPGGEAREVIELRRELECDFFELLFGGSPW
jgi:hypothetical protein